MNGIDTGVAKSQKIQKDKFGHMKSQILGQILKDEKRQNKGQMSFEDLLKSKISSL